MIVYSIVITAILMSALVCLLYEHIGRMNAQDEVTVLEHDLTDARQIIRSYQIEKANRDGVEAGMKANTLYKQFLEQFDNHQQVTVLLGREDGSYYDTKH